MNQASTPQLAAAVFEAGAFPSLWIRDSDNNGLDIDYVHDTIQEFYKLTGHANVLIPVCLNDLKNEKLMSVIKQFKVSHMEVWGLVRHINGQKLNFEKVSQIPSVIHNVKLLKEISKILIRIIDPIDLPLIHQFDGICVKGQESAGLTGDWSVKDLFCEQKKINPNAVLIPYGGIGTPSQVSEYIKAGAEAVGVGTLFAACKESPLSFETKQKIIQSSAAALSKDNKTGQNLLWLSESVEEDPYDWNKTLLLKEGIHSKGDKGFVYVGHSIQHVNSLRTVKETVEFLVSEISHVNS